MLNGKNAVVTGGTRGIGAAICENGEIRYALTRKIDAVYHGTGDVFASAMIGALLNDRSLQAAVQIAVNFTRESIEKTICENYIYQFVKIIFTKVQLQTKQNYDSIIIMFYNV